MKKAMILFILIVPFLFQNAMASGKEEKLILPVVMYHHISKLPREWNDYVVSIDEFTSDMNYLRENGWHSVGVSELIAWSEGEYEMPDKPFMLTFDDGFESTLAYAEPIIRERGFCAVVAIIGSVCEKFSQCGEHDAEWSNLSWEDAAAMEQSGIFEMQCHTWNMHALGKRKGCGQMRWESDAQYAAALGADLAKFSECCKRNGVSTVPSIAYPYGEYCAETEKIIRENGFLAAFTCTERINELDRAADALYNISRFNRPHGVNSEKFFSKWEEAVDKR